MSSDLRIRVLGAGVAGLAGALALRRRGVEDVVVLERDSPAQVRARPGHGMMLMADGVEALRILGVDGFLGGHRALERAVFQDRRGHVLRCETLDGAYCVTRRGLVDALRAGLPSAVVEYGRRCTSVVLDPCHSPVAQRRVRVVTFADGTPLRRGDVDLLVGADGVRSALATALNPGLTRTDSRVLEIVMSSRLPALAAHLGATFLKTVLAERGLAFGLLSPCADHVIGFLQFDARRHGVPAARVGPGLAQFALALLGDVPDVVAGFLRDADASTAHLWRPIDGDVATSLSSADAVVIGDAAHPLLPFCSQGVGAALLDAVWLADAVAGAGRDELAHALAGFCERRRPDAAAFVRSGRRILSHFVSASPGFIAPYVRDARDQPAALLARGSGDDDPLFADGAVELTTLRRRAYNHRWAVQPVGVIPLTAADPDFPVCDQIITAVQRHLAAGYIPYGPPEGLPELRDAACETLRRRHGLSCDPDTLLATDGAASAVFLAARLLLPNPGDEAIIPDPVDFLLERSVRAAGGIVRRWPTIDGHYDTTALEALITPRTRLISLCNPHNPLGRVLDRDELEAIADVALRHDLQILSDEVWSDIIYAPAVHIPIATLGSDVAARTFTVYGFSKSYGLAGMRLGLLAAPDADRRRRLMTLANADDTAYGASTISQVAGTAAYELADDWLARFTTHLRHRRDQTIQRLNAIPGVRCAQPQGTFVAFPDVSRLGIGHDELAARLRDDHGVAVVPGTPAYFGPAATGHLRLSFATSRTILTEGLDRIEAGLRTATGQRTPAIAA